MQTHKSYCRNCLCFCGIEVDVEDNKAVAVRGDPDNPLSRGYTCVKGRSLPAQHNGPERLRRSLKRMSDGAHQPIDVERAMDEIAAKLQDVIARHGPDAIALWKGNSHAETTLTKPLSEAWLAGIGSKSVSSPVTIDQPAKKIVPHIHGAWGGGMQPFWTADVWMVLGTNPLISHTPGYDSGMPGHNPSRRLGDQKLAGMKLIVVDPRKTETAHRAEIHLQIRPGEDAALLAGMVRIIIAEKLYDTDFVETYTIGLDKLRVAVDPFDLDWVAGRTGLPREQIEGAAHLFAAGPRGCATTGTGIDMSRNPTLTEFLVACLNTLCGRYNRAGDAVNNPGVLLPPRRWKAQVAPPMRPWLKTPRARVRSLPMFFGEICAASFPDEILTPGEGQIRALIVVAGNPAVSIPDQVKTVAALRDLELLVVIDPWMTATARLADFVIAPVLSFERADHTAAFIDGRFPLPYAQYAEKLVVPDSALIEDWKFFWGLAHRMRTQLKIPVAQGWGALGVWRTEELSLDKCPTNEDLLDLVVRGSRIPLSEVRARASGAIFADDEIVVEPGDPAAGKLDFAPQDLIEEMQGVYTRNDAADAAFDFRLVNSRMREVFNSTLTLMATLKTGRETNLAYLNPEDMARRDIRTGDEIEIASAHGRTLALAAPAPELREGVLAIAQCWGGLPGEEHEHRTRGANTNLLIDATEDFCPVSGMPLMSAIPVNIRATGAR